MSLRHLHVGDNHLLWGTKKYRGGKKSLEQKSMSLAPSGSVAWVPKDSWLAESRQRFSSEPFQKPMERLCKPVFFFTGFQQWWSLGWTLWHHMPLWHPYDSSPLHSTSQGTNSSSNSPNQLPTAPVTCHVLLCHYPLGARNLNSNKHLLHETLKKFG